MLVTYAWHPGLLLVVTPGVKPSSQPALSSSDHLLVQQIGWSYTSCNVPEFDLFAPIWGASPAPFMPELNTSSFMHRGGNPTCRILVFSVPPDLLQNYLASGWAVCQAGDIAPVGNLFFVTFAHWLQSLQKFSHAVSCLQESHVHCSTQDGSREYSGVLSTFLTCTTSLQASLSCTLHHFKSFSPTYRRPMGISQSRSCQTRMVSLWWWQTSGRGQREEAAKFSLLGFWVRLGLLPTITQSFLWVVKVTADIQKRPCPPFPQGYPNTQHSAVWWRLKSQKCWTQRYPALVQITTDIVCMTNGDTDLEPCAALPRGSLSRETLSPSYVQEDPWSPTMFHRRWPGDAFLSHTVDRNRGYLWILVFKNRKQKGTFSPRRREFLPRKGDRPKGFPSAPCATHHSQLWFLHIPVDTCFLQASHFTSH